MVPRKEELYNIKFDKKEVAACLTDKGKATISVFRCFKYDSVKI